MYVTISIEQAYFLSTSRSYLLYLPGWIVIWRRYDVRDDPMGKMAKREELDLSGAPSLGIVFLCAWYGCACGSDDGGVRYSVFGARWRRRFSAW